MSLVGKLEDLGLGEILQIVALSGKSGILHVKSHGRVGKIYFFKGKVVSAFSDAYRVNLGEFLIHKGYTTPDVIRNALERQKKLNFTEKLGSLLIREFGVAKDKIEECVTDLIEKSVFSLFYWMEGEFQFELTDEVKSEAISVDLLQYDLAQQRGLNPQFLAMEGTRILDERGKDGAVPAELQPPSPPVGFPSTEAAPAAAAVAAAPAPAYEPVFLLVDEYAIFRNVIKRSLEEKKYRIETAETVAEARKKLDQLTGSGEPVIIITSLIIPRSDDQGILGGVELVESIPDSVNVPVIVTCDYSIPEAEEQLRNRNVVFLKKPKRSMLTRENIESELRFFLKTLEKSMGEFLTGGRQAEPEKGSRWDQEIKAEFQMTDEGGPVSTTPGLTVLKSLVSELSKAESGNEIILMILRLASEIMPRGIVFAVKNDRLHGLGQFGLEGFIDQPLKLVKALTLPVDGTVAEVITNGVPFRGTPPDEQVFAQLYERLGGHRPTEIFLSTIASGDKALVFFYGDNLPSNTPIRDTDALEIFFTQAGFTMERLLLEKK